MARCIARHCTSSPLCALRWHGAVHVTSTGPSQRTITMDVGANEQHGGAHSIDGNDIALALQVVQVSAVCLSVPYNSERARAAEARAAMIS